MIKRRGMVLFMHLAALVAVSSGADAVISEAVGAGLQGNVRRALQILRPVDDSGLSAEDRTYVRCMRSRFGNERHIIESRSDTASRAIRIYREYWQQATLDPEHEGAAQMTLRRRLQQLLGAPESASQDALEERLKVALAARGLGSLEGRTGVLRELMVWSKSETHTEAVKLPDSVREVRVTLLSGFRSLGWGDYATCGRRGAGGWATKDGLVAVVPRYQSLNGEEFRVTFLAHETQHFADLQRFPHLEPWELEFRAKLTELSLADATIGKILQKFMEDRGDDPRSPHSYANRQVLSALVRRMHLASPADLFTVAPARMRSTAEEALKADTVGRLPDVTGSKTARVPFGLPD